VSNSLAIATVTATIADLIRAAIDRNVAGSVPGAVVTHVPLGSPELDPSAPGVNLYLYDVRRNAGLASNDLPAGNPGGLVNRPQVALNLQYILTFFGDDRRLEPQRLMGTVLSALHAEPMLSRQLIHDTVHHYDYLASSDLAEQIEPVKVTDVTLTIDELSRLWPVFLTGNYRLSHVFEAAVVLIDEPSEPQEPLPVGKAFVRAIPFHEPSITAVGADDPSGEILPGSLVVVRGSHLAGEITQVMIDGNAIVPLSVSEGQIRFRVDASWPWLQPGIAALRVLQFTQVGDQQRLAGASNSVALIVHPRVALRRKEPSDQDIRLVFGIEPAVGPGQSVSLLLNGVDGLPSFRFEAEPRADVSGEVSFERLGGITGDFLVRIDVSGVQSLLEVGADHSYDGPRLTLP
jgi:hypothetical protein